MISAQGSVQFQLYSNSLKELLSHFIKGDNCHSSFATLYFCLQMHESQSSNVTVNQHQHVDRGVPSPFGWMRLSILWRIMQIKEGFHSLIHHRLTQITTCSTYIILYIRISYHKKAKFHTVSSHLVDTRDRWTEETFFITNYWGQYM